MQMKTLILLLCLFAVPIATQNYYDSKYDNYDIESLIRNTRLLKLYLECFLSRRPCTPVGKVFKGT